MKKLIILLFAFTLAACDLQGGLFSSEPNYEGTYASILKGSNGESVIREHLKITKKDGAYFISTSYGEDGWSGAHPAAPISRDMLKTQFLLDTSTSVSGISSGKGALIVTPKNYSKGKIKTETGYYGYWGIGYTELIKID